jgi:8-oxo-dGTP pyrophosphatase MutT (NUDIX family)
MNKTRTLIRDIVERIDPFDGREHDVIQRVLGWLDEGQEPRLVSKFILVDHYRRSLLLVNKSGRWLPVGGPVEPFEDPRGAVLREMAEELGPRAAMVASVAMMPLFITGNAEAHLWYVVAGDEKMWLETDRQELDGHRWQPIQDVLDTNISELDPEMHRFTRKLLSRI